MYYWVIHVAFAISEHVHTLCLAVAKWFEQWPVGREISCSCSVGAHIKLFQSTKLGPGISWGCNLENPYENEAYKINP